MGGKKYTGSIMKLMLSMLFCSAVYQQCMTPHVMPDTYTNWYECMMAGYDEGKRKMIDVGKIQANRDGTYIKFYCTPDKRPTT